jgi:hypothetical protein
VSGGRSRLGSTERETDPGPPYEVRWHPRAAAEYAAIADVKERVAIQHAREKLEAEGPRLRFPHQSAARGGEGQGLRELRPRRGRSRCRPIFRRVKPDAFVILAVGPEAQIDQRAFRAAVSRARDDLTAWRTLERGPWRR